MVENPTRICELLVGLGDVEVLGVEGLPVGALVLHVRTRRRPACGGCGGAVWSKGSPSRTLGGVGEARRPRGRPPGGTR